MSATELRSSPAIPARPTPATEQLGIKKAWAATIEYTPDHLPLLGPLVQRDGAEVRGATVASACGHGMMWGPAVSRIATDLALDGVTDVVERAADFRMDRFDADGNPPFVDPVALRHAVAARPEHVGEEARDHRLVLDYQ